EWSDEVAGANPLDTIKASIDKKYSYLVSNISLARALNEKFSLGAGLNYIYMNDATKISKAFASSPATAGLGYTGYSISLEHESSGGALEATAGFLYKPLEKLSIGGVFRSGTEITLKGTAKHARKGLTGAGLPDASVESKYEEKYNYPMTYGLGAAYQLTEKFLISAGFDANLYSNRKTNVSYTDPAAPFLLDNETSKGHWKDVYQYRIGAEYAVSDKLDLRGGFYTDPAIIDTDNITLINTDQYSLNAFSMGLGYKISDSLNLDANVSYAFSKKLSKDDRDYDYPVVSLRTGVGYSF
ncbi:MAG: outer membrane beta-barrel protein, partial [Elusimicrobia bacterium]|nr:outer membrane beta-barrel protein [Elusimicrobiota bacterium]